MANELAHDLMCTLWDEVAETTSMKMSLSKDLEIYNMSGDSNDDRATNATDNANDAGGSDREYIPQEYRFETQDGIVSTDGDFQDIIDRMIPVNRGKAKRVLAFIDAKGLRDPQRRKKVMQGFARDIANTVDLTCYQTMIDQSTMAVVNSTAFDYQAPIDAEVLMLNYGLGAYDKNLFLSNKDYAKVAKDLGQNQYYGKEGLPNDALTKAQLPDLATFDTMRSDYLINLAAPTPAALSINGNQEHTVSTYDANDFYLDNRSMSLAVTNSTAATMPVGTKFTIEDVNFIHPETREDTGELLTFTVITTGTGTVTVQPAIVATGPYRNASAGAVTGKAVTVLNIADSNPSLFYTPESTVLIPGRLPVPADAENVTSIEATTEQGLPMRMTYRYDFHKERYEMKALIFFDVQVVYPNQLGMILSNQV
ncbi:MAG: hypothetical protein CMJ25_13650 [Phycisphaerae bacterium]|nr:hypothetical protein [Phycisphaerae bacterium]|tara:strand:- start:4680 stop:5951 length:1272 start_codon:yes stop_codon:yes gene_type:complete